MSQGLDHSSVITPPPSLALQPPSTAVLSGKGDLSDDDRHLSHERVPAASSLTFGSNISSSSHRRANTEIISRPTLPSKQQLFMDQSKTVEDLDCSNTNAPTQTLAKKRLEVGARRLSDWWFQGKSEPTNMRQPTDPDATPVVSSQPFNMERRNSRDAFDSPSVSPSRAQKRMTPPSPLKQVTTPNRFSFFGLKRQEETKPELPEPAEDELLNLDVDAALFPAGSDNLQDQEAFDALRNNAGTMIRRLQAAYKQRTFALHEANAEKNEKQDELEETRTRVGNLKAQLDGMAEKVQQQEQAIKAMAEELEIEKQLRQREEESRRHSVMLVKPAEDDATSDSGAESTNLRRNSKRASTITSDSGFESGDESSAESVFSRRDGVGSPTSTVALSPNISQVALSPPTSSSLQPNRKEPKPASEPQPPQYQQQLPQRSSAYNRVIKGLASTTSSWMGNSSKCTICRGVPSSEAWSILGMLKEENRGLKTRLGELEMVIDDCLGLVGP